MVDQNGGFFVELDGLKERNQSVLLSVLGIKDEYYQCSNHPYNTASGIAASRLETCLLASLA